MKNELKMRTALVRNESGNLAIIRDEYYDTNKDFRDDLRGNGFKVLHIWGRYVSDFDVDEWEFMNRK